jgi:2-polyprenyl-3-methyl-5-hydroxy-6-metoxy-1,4-benzoquinol methylase/DNA-directed RNA polymerase subunit RPC12/RpoP
MIFPKQSSCLICSSKKIQYAFSIKRHRTVRCTNCGFIFINPQPSNDTLKKIYNEDYFLLAKFNGGEEHTSALKRKTADAYLDKLFSQSRISKNSTLLEIGCGNGDFLLSAALRGLKVTGVEFSPHAAKIAQHKIKAFGGEVIVGEIGVLPTLNKFDHIVFCDVLEHVRSPRDFLKKVYNLLKDSGSVLCVVPSLDSWSARFLKADWMEFKLEHLTYFDSKTLRSLFYQENFFEISQFEARKILSLKYISAHFFEHPVKFWSTFFRILSSTFPSFILKKPFPIVASGIGLIASKKKKLPGKVASKLSVIMPVYNEEYTVENTIRSVLKKKIEGVKIELIIVESNSEDKSRDIVRKFLKHPRVKIYLQDKPLGKGNAVRLGISMSSSDFVLIQDADNEYDIDDYDHLIERLRDGRESFVLGARHGNARWKIREFGDQPVQAFILNFGHWFFTFLLWLFYGVWLRDHATMFKVFRRDCIRGMEFECNRFDFDLELLIKLIKRGYIPEEIPVNYRSRSFSEGKKIRFILDPLTWIKAIVKFRFN